MSQVPHRYIAIEGPIGVGKTSLARRLAETLNAQLVLEQAEANPFLERFYRNPRVGALPAQLFFLFQRAQQQAALAQADMFGSVRVADYLLAKDDLFARMILDDEEYGLYRQVHDRLAINAPKPDLVVWQLGTNDVVWHGIARDAKQSLRKGVERLKKANADVILMDLQDSPVVRTKPARGAMEKLISSVAREAAVGLFPRYHLMQRAHASGVGGLVAFDGLHNSGDGYLCIGRALARMIDKQARP